MEPVGITNACTSVVVRNSSSRMVMVHSAMVPRGISCAVPLLSGTCCANVCLSSKAPSWGLPNLIV